MKIYDLFLNYTYCLIHPFKTHELYLSNEEDANGFKPHILGIYESLGASWIFVVLSGIFRIALLNLVLFMFIHLFSTSDSSFNLISSEDGYLGFYFLLFQTILDVIFYPLAMLFLIQFWEFTIKLFGKALGSDEDLDEKVKNIMSVALSSSILSIIPIFGGMAQKFASLILMYAGLRKQLNISVSLSLCIMMMPIVMFLGITSLVVFLYILNLA
jgi:hypothetical protein